jgi:hypothetical protein
MKAESLFGLGAVLLLLAGCAGAPTNEGPEEEAASGVESTDGETSDGTIQEVEVDEGLLSVEVTIPADFYAEMSEAEILAAAEEAGYSKATINADGSVTYEMSRAVYNEVLDDMKVGLDELIEQSMAENPDVFTDIKYDSDVTQFDVTVNRSAFEGNFEAGFIGFGLGFGGLFYQIFSGVEKADQQVVIDFIDAGTGEVFDSQVWPYEE